MNRLHWVDSLLIRAVAVGSGVGAVAVGSGPAIVGGGCAAALHNGCMMANGAAGGGAE